MIKLIVTNCIFVIFALLCSVSAHANIASNHKALKGINDTDQTKLIRIIESFPNFQSFLRGHIPSQAFNIDSSINKDGVSELDIAVQRTVLQNKYFQVSEVYYYMVNIIEDSKKNDYIIPSSSLKDYLDRCSALSAISDKCLVELAIRPIIYEALDAFSFYNLDKAVVWNALSKLIQTKPKYYFLYETREWNKMKIERAVSTINLYDLFFQCVLAQDDDFDINQNFNGYKCTNVIVNHLKSVTKGLQSIEARGVYNRIQYNNPELMAIQRAFRNDVLAQDTGCGYWGRTECEEAFYSSKLVEFLVKNDAKASKVKEVAKVIAEHFED